MGKVHARVVLIVSHEIVPMCKCTWLLASELAIACASIIQMILANRQFDRCLTFFNLLIKQFIMGL